MICFPPAGDEAFSVASNQLKRVMRKVPQPGEFDLVTQFSFSGHFESFSLDMDDVQQGSVRFTNPNSESESNCHGLATDS